MHLICSISNKLPARIFLSYLLTFFILLLSACGGGSEDQKVSCNETGPYACATGESEPLYYYQWALKSAYSFFSGYPDISDGSTDIHVESVHAQGIKGAGVRVLILDDGIEINHIELKGNIDPGMTWNYETNSPDPTPSGNETTHGTSVAGVIGAMQNGIGMMGVAPKAIIGGARFVNIPGVTPNYIEAYGGAPWSRNADVINASFDRSPAGPDTYDPNWGQDLATQNLPKMRNGKGLVVVQVAGNHYLGEGLNPCPVINVDGGINSIIGCGNAGYDSPKLYLPVVVTGAVNAKGIKATYSNSGSNIWLVAPGGESKTLGNFGEYGASDSEYGPSILSLDFMGCIRGKSRIYITPNILDFLIGFLVSGSKPNLATNLECNYRVINATSAATPHVTGVIALMLSVNPKLGWRDIREILRLSSRKIDLSYGSRSSRDHQVQLDAQPSNTSITPTLTDSTSTALIDGSKSARIDYGWVKNAAGNSYSNWYGWGLVDAAAAVELAKTYSSFKPVALEMPNFNKVITNAEVSYGKVRLLGSFTVNEKNPVDQLQLLINTAPASSNLACMGSVGIYVKSPSGTISILQTPYNTFYNNQNDHDGGKISLHEDFSLASYAFYGEGSQGLWSIYAVSGNPLVSSPSCGQSSLLDISYRIFPAY